MSLNICDNFLQGGRNQLARIKKIRTEVKHENPDRAKRRIIIVAVSKATCKIQAAF